MSFTYFEVDSHISTYNKFRPVPPESLIKRIVEYTSEKFSGPLELAVDVGCGSGQSTEVFASYFKKVIGIDPSPGIIEEARKKCSNPNVFYCTSPGEKMSIDNNAANLISVCQALHWLDISKFYTEANRILMSKGVLAIYGYNLPTIIYEDNKKIEKIVEKYYKDILGEYTLPGSRQVYLDNYTAKEYNEVYFIEGGKMQREENFLLTIQGTVNDLIGYITSWSAFQNFIKQKGADKGQDLLKGFREEFTDILKTEDEKLSIVFNYFLLLGRKK